MALFDYMLEAINKRKKAPVTAPVVEVDELAEVKARLKKIVYDDAVVDQLAPIFGKLNSDEYAPVWELLEAKEAMLSEVSEDLFKQETTPTVKSTDKREPDLSGDKIQTAEDILRAQYSAK